jgi:uncharacterized coiled-coil protein SlyX|tara:strand:+ start:240 stop:401 length:162 start_codon:yes stop_codon:yes gene_type:complete
MEELKEELESVKLFSEQALNEFNKNVASEEKELERMLNEINSLAESCLDYVKE